MTTCQHPKCQPNPQPATHHTPRGLPLCDHHAAEWNKYRAALPIPLTEPTHD